MGHIIKTFSYDRIMQKHQDSQITFFMSKSANSFTRELIVLPQEAIVKLPAIRVRKGIIFSFDFLEAWSRIWHYKRKYLTRISKMM